MGRIRTIKPEAFLDEELWDAEIETGLPLFRAFTGLWTQADREGRFEWLPRRLKAAVLPYWDGDFSAVLEALAAGRFVLQYVVDDRTYGLVRTFRDHQVVNQREAKSVIPEPTHSDCSATHVHAHAQFNGVNIPAELRETVLSRDGRRCVRCESTIDLTIDHIFPRSIGGTHVVGNLRTLCRSCNSARPVQGQALLDDLALDGLTLDDMPRMCMHVQDSGEGKGKEGKEKKKNRAKRSVPEDFPIDDAMWNWATRETPTVDVEAATAAFIDDRRSKGVTYTDPVLGWRTWMRNAIKWGPHKAGMANGTTDTRNATERSVDELLGRDRRG